MRTRTRITLAGLALGAALAGGVAWATIPADSVYTACKLKVTGTIRLIDPAGPSNSLLSHCTSYETQISWNQKGPAGAAGINGTNGVDGKDGAAGAKGTDGENGSPGLPGLAALERVDQFASVPQKTDPFFFAVAEVVAPCPQGKKVISGGYSAPFGNPDFFITHTRPTEALDGWTVRFVNGNSQTSYGVNVYAVCALVSP
jgi:Collagen triple helix repeat (20 copies)